MKPTGSTRSRKTPYALLTKKKKTLLTRSRGPSKSSLFNGVASLAMKGFVGQDSGDNSGRKQTYIMDCRRNIADIEPIKSFV